MTRVAILAFAALACTFLVSWLSYLAGWHAGQREQARSSLRDIEVLRRAEDDRVQVDVRVAGLAAAHARGWMTAAEEDVVYDWLAKVVDS